MRVSVDKSDPGYALFERRRAAGEIAIIHLNGIIQPFVVTADDEKGEIVKHVLNERGLIHVDPNDHSKVHEETICGRVEIFFRPRPLPSEPRA